MTDSAPWGVCYSPDYDDSGDLLSVSLTLIDCDDMRPSDRDGLPTKETIALRCHGTAPRL